MNKFSKALNELSEYLMGGIEKIEQIHQYVDQVQAGSGETVYSPFLVGFIVFILSIFIGYYVVWKVTPALHSPLMSVTNAISSVIVVGALIAVTANGNGISTFLGFLGTTLAAINIFGGFVITQRMLAMFNKKGK